MIKMSSGVLYCEYCGMELDGVELIQHLGSEKVVVLCEICYNELLDLAEKECD